MTTALVLSAGGMFGAYQAGAWRALARVLSPDLVVGTSAGALNGWSIAGGCPPEDLVNRWLDPSTEPMMHFRPRLRAWKGCFDPGPLEAWTRTLCEQFRPLVPFGLTMVEVPRLRPRLVRGEEVTWRHLMAACAVPFGYPPVKIDGKRYVDGGLLGALPLWAAAEMGATRAIAVDVLPVMPSAWLRAAVRVAGWLGSRPGPPAGLEVIRVSRAEPLGNLRDAVHWNLANARRWIEMGEEDGARVARGLTTERSIPLK